jgi:branched-chain amino acid transport system permease protein
VIKTILDVVIAGLLMGGIYAIIAVGFSLQYGVARVLNVSHGEFIMIGAFLTWTLYTIVGINPLVSLAIVGPITFIIGFLLHRTLFTHLKASSPSPGDFEGSSLLASFGLLYIIQNTAIVVWGAEVKGYSYLTSSFDVLGAVFATNRLVTALFAIGIGIAFYVFLARSRIGKAIRAAAQDATMAGLIGVNINQVLALCFGLGALMAGFGGTLVSMMYSIQPAMGFQYTMIAIIVVVLGGLGSITGSFIGGFILGLVGSIVSYWQPALALVAYYVLFMLLLFIRPAGIMGK